MATHFLRFVNRNKGSVACRLSENETNHDDDKDNDQPMENASLENNNGAQVNEQTGVEDGTEVQVASGSPLPASATR